MRRFLEVKDDEEFFNLYKKYILFKTKQAIKARVIGGYAGFCNELRNLEEELENLTYKDHQSIAGISYMIARNFSYYPSHSFLNDLLTVDGFGRVVNYRSW